VQHDHHFQQAETARPMPRICLPAPHMHVPSWRLPAQSKIGCPSSCNYHLVDAVSPALRSGLPFDRSEYLDGRNCLVVRQSTGVHGPFVHWPLVTQFHRTYDSFHRSLAADVILLFPASHAGPAQQRRRNAASQPNPRRYSVSLAFASTKRKMTNGGYHRVFSRAAGNREVAGKGRQNPERQS